MAGVNPRAVILRLFGREYLPMAGTLLTWAVIAATLGHADAARLFAATMFVRSARALTMLDTGTAMRRRHGADAAVYRISLHRAVRIELVSFLASVVVLAVLVAALDGIGMRNVAQMTLLIAVSMPARHFAPAAGGRRRAGLFRLLIGWSGLALVGTAMLFDYGLIAVALALGLREWAALAGVLALRPAAHPDPRPATVPLDLKEVAGITATRARHRLAYRIGRGMLTFVPLGGVVARTIRGLGGHRRIKRVTPRNSAPIALIAGGAAAVGFLLPALVREPAALIASASLLRVAAAAGNVLIWWRFASDLPDGDDDDDDDD